MTQMCAGGEGAVPVVLCFSAFINSNSLQPPTLSALKNPARGRTTGGKQGPGMTLLLSPTPRAHNHPTQF